MNTDFTLGSCDTGRLCCTVGRLSLLSTAGSVDATRMGIHLVANKRGFRRTEDGEEDLRDCGPIRGTDEHGSDARLARSLMDAPPPDDGGEESPWWTEDDAGSSLACGRRTRARRCPISSRRISCLAWPTASVRCMATGRKRGGRKVARRASSKRMRLVLRSVVPAPEADIRPLAMRPVGASLASEPEAWGDGKRPCSPTSVLEELMRVESTLRECVGILRVVGSSARDAK